MAEAQSTAKTVWEGDLAHGSGTTSMASGLGGDFPVTWASRTARSKDKTSPEELLAAAHAACYSMALSHGLSGIDHPPERLDVTATVTFDPEAANPVKSSHLEVRGTVPGMDQDEFARAADAAKDGCPVSKALAGNVELSVDAALA